MLTHLQHGKSLTEEGIKKDLDYLLLGIDCHLVLSQVCPPRPGLRVLEPGCGSGKLGLWYALRGANVTLLDIDPDALTYAQELYYRALQASRQGQEYPNARHVDCQPGSILALSQRYQRNTFDFVFNEGVPHHWGYSPRDSRRQRAINQMVRVTRPGGWVCIIGSNAHCPATVAMAEHTEHTYLGMPPKQKPFTRDELATRLTNAGLSSKTVKVIPVSSVVGLDRWEDSPLLAGYGQK